MNHARAESEDWLGRADRIAPLILEWRDAGERKRCLPDPIVDSLKDQGFFRLWVPRALGGFEVAPATMIRVVEAIARYDGSVAWMLMASANSALLSAYLPIDGASEVFRSPQSVVAGSLHRGGEATIVPGGFRLTGRWRLATGVLNATWIICTAAVGRDGRDHIFIVSAKECRILDVWDPPGLRGTGTHDFEVEDVFVPERRHAPPGGHHSVQGPLYDGQMAPLINPPLAAVAFGIARDALDEFTRLSRSKKPARGNGTLSERSTIHELVGRAEARLLAARSFLLAATEELWSFLSAGVKAPADVTARVLIATAYGTEQAVRAVDAVFTAAGSSSIVSANRLERCFRDVHVVNHHDAASPFMFERFGHYLLCRRSED